MDNKSYYPELDIAKGIGIILVVFGHAITQYSKNVEGLWLYIYHFVYTFHMPLFFFISGVLIYKTVSQSAFNRWDAIKKRFNRLMVPYFFIGLLFIPINYLFANVKRYSYSLNDLSTILLGNNPEGELWYLYVLFVFSSLAIIVVNKKNVVTIVFVSLIISMIAPYIKVSLESIGLGFSLYQIFPFVLGILVGFYRETIKRLENRTSLSILIVSLLLIISLIYYIFGMPGYLRIYVTLFMMYIIMTVSILLNRGDGKIKGILSLLGRYSMDIYIMHHSVFVCLRMFFGESGRLMVSRLSFVLVGSIISTVIPIIISRYIIRKNGFLSFHILGLAQKG